MKRSLSQQLEYRLLCNSESALQEKRRNRAVFEKNILPVEQQWQDLEVRTPIANPAELSQHLE
ncbi:FAA hydrolase family protein [Sesbania bispinosa]|nr:FAA hydrolase family protein [Sesbania bispinosa]